MKIPYWGNSYSIDHFGGGKESLFRVHAIDYAGTGDPDSEQNSNIEPQRR